MQKLMVASPYEHVPLESLVFDPRNARVHPEDNIAAIRNSLATFGQTVPLVVQRGTNIVVSGNGRLEAMRQLEMATAQVLYVDWDDAKLRAYALVDNRTSETSHWDFEKLSREADELLAMDDGIPLDTMGFDEEFMASLTASPVDDDDDGPQEDRPKHGKPVQCTPEQREIFDKGCALLRENHGDDISEGRCLELLAADYLAGA